MAQKLSVTRRNLFLRPLPPNHLINGVSRRCDLSLFALSCVALACILSIYLCPRLRTRCAGLASGKPPNEAHPSRCALAHAPTAIPRPGSRPLCPPVDAPSCSEGLLRHGRDAAGISKVSLHLQRCSGSRHS